MLPPRPSNQYVTYARCSCTLAVSNQLSIARWVALGFVVLQIFTIALAIALRFVIAEEQPYDAFDAQCVDDAVPCSSYQMLHIPCCTAPHNQLHFKSLALRHTLQDLRAARQDAIQPGQGH